jgi:hypothetical protein
MITFETYGPFAVPIKDRALDKSREAAFWSSVEEAAPGLSGAIGCYIFAVRAGRGMRPWYVGKTDRAGFKREVFQDNKFRLYFEILRQRKRGTALLFFIARHTPRGRFAKVSVNENRAISTLEELLIGTALTRNPKLINKRATKHFREIQVPGYMNESAGARPKDARQLATLLGVGRKMPKDTTSALDIP